MTPTWRHCNSFAQAVHSKGQLILRETIHNDHCLSNTGTALQYCCDIVSNNCNTVWTLQRNNCCRELSPCNKRDPKNCAARTVSISTYCTPSSIMQSLKDLITALEAFLAGRQTRANLQYFVWVNRGYYMAARGYEFYLRVLKVSHCARWRYDFLVKGKILVFHQYLYNNVE